MSITELVLQDYKEAVSLAPYDQALKDALKTNERVPAFINNVIKEIVKVERTHPKLLTRDNIKMITYDATNMFLSGIQEMYRRREMTDLSRLAEDAKRTAAAERKAQINSMLDRSTIDGGEL